MTNNVLNYFEQPNSGNDNKLIIGGSQESAGGVNTKAQRLTVDIDDISTAGSVWVVPGFAGTLTKITTVLYGAITGADAVVTAEIGGTLVTGSSITIANASSAAGDVDSSTPSAANVFTATQAIEIITSGASTGTVKVTVTLDVEPL